MSQTARILGVLQDGQPHLVSEIHMRSGYSRLNSRISDLRARGYVIECFHVPNRTGSEGYGYTLISEPQNCPDATDPPRVTADDEDAADTSSAASGQLSFSEAA